MTLSRSTLWLWAAVLLPVVGLSALVAKSEVAVRSGQLFRIPIRGYDPRDLLRGQYLQYEYNFDWQDEDSCPYGPAYSGKVAEATVNARAKNLSEECCLCLSDNPTTDLGPAIRQVHCTEPALDGCKAWLRTRDVMPPQRYFVPEERARALEDALRTQPASIELAIVRGKPPAVRELYLRNRPWRETLGLRAPTK